MEIRKPTDLVPPEGLHAILESLVDFACNGLRLICQSQDEYTQDNNSLAHQLQGKLSDFVEETGLGAQQPTYATAIQFYIAAGENIIAFLKEKAG